MDAIKALFSAVGLVLLVVFLTPAIMTIMAYIGYFFGMILSFFAGSILTGIFGITTQTIPVVTAWIFVLISVVITSISRKKGDNNA